MQFHAFEPCHRSSFHIAILVAVGLIPLVLWFVATAWRVKPLKYQRGKKIPLLYPSSASPFGSLFSMAWDSPGLISAVTARFCEVPTRLRLLFIDIYVISGPRNIRRVWKEPDLHNKAYKALSVHNMFNMPKDTLAFWMEDDSGHHSQPRPGSQVLPRLRIDYLTHSSVSKFLTGDGLKPFARRFATNLTQRLSTNTRVSAEWSNSQDLFEFLQVELFPAAVEAMWGKHFFAINPSFIEDFWAFSKVLPGLAKGYPRWCFPKHYQARDRCFRSIRRWHAFISTHLDYSKYDETGWNEDYGADFVKFRWTAWSTMPRMGAEGAATEDLGMIWAANGNSIPAAYWMIAEVIRDPALLARIRPIIDSYRIEPEAGNVDFVYAKLCTDPLLESIYAETLRLHAASFIMRGPAHPDFDLNGWHIPKDAVMLMSSYNAQTDARYWSTEGEQPFQPVDQFWAERFLVCQKSRAKCANPSSASVCVHSQISEKPADRGKTSAAPEFSLKGRSDHWFPYGGGQRLCPGRHFAKQEMLSSLALVLTMFDIELTDKAGKIPLNDMAGFGFGTLWPKGKTAVRIRRRTNEVGTIGP